jgi:AcrR family transcriptional regulator
MRKDGGSNRSRALLLTAVTEILDSVADAERVTITDVVAAAGLTRPTFYAVFEDLPAAFAASALARLESAFAGVDVDPDVDASGRPEAMRTAVVAVLTRLAEHADFFARVLRGPGGPAVHERIVEYVAERIRRSSPVSRALASSGLPVQMSSEAIAAGAVWTMTRWIDEEPRRPLADVAVQLRDYVEASVFGGLSSLGGQMAPSRSAAPVDGRDLAPS